uniref:Alternative protein USPL1 n=1 Tax=Homo sapiens TaxID=9606 RepID=L8ECC7_HUMAN|nr:alternative protein USPL1 [Homo sapiens]
MAQLPTHMLMLLQKFWKSLEAPHVELNSTTVLMGMVFLQQTMKTWWKVRFINFV